MQTTQTLRLPFFADPGREPDTTKSSPSSRDNRPRDWRDERADEGRLPFDADGGRGSSRTSATEAGRELGLSVEAGREPLADPGKKNAH